MRLKGVCAASMLALLAACGGHGDGATTSVLQNPADSSLAMLVRTAPGGATTVYAGPYDAAASRDSYTPQTPGFVQVAQASREFTANWNGGSEIDLCSAGGGLTPPPQVTVAGRTIRVVAQCGLPGSAPASGSSSATVAATAPVAPAPAAPPPGAAPDMSSLAGESVPVDQLPLLRTGQWRLTNERGSRETCMSSPASQQQWNAIAEIAREGRNCQSPQYTRTGGILTASIRCQDVTATETVGGDFNSQVSMSVETTHASMGGGGPVTERQTLMAQYVGDCPTN